MYNNSNLLLSDDSSSSPPFGSNLNAFTTQDHFQNRRDGYKHSSNSFANNHKDMSFSKNIDDEGYGFGFPDNGQPIQRRENNDNYNYNEEGQDNLFNMFTQNKPSLQNIQSSSDLTQQPRLKNLSFQGNDSDRSYGNGLNYSNDSSIPHLSQKQSSKFGGQSPRQKMSQFQQKQGSEEEEQKFSPRVLSPSHQSMLRRSLEQLTPNIIDQGLKQLRQMNEIKQVKPLASPSVIFNHCIDEEEIVLNIRGLARELRNIGKMEKDLEKDLKEKLEDKEETITKKKRNNEVFNKLFHDANEKEKKLHHLQLEKEREIEVMQNISAVNKKSEQILQEKKNYVKIHERVDSIIYRKQMKRDQASLLKKMEETSYISKSPFQKKNKTSNYQQNTALDYSQSTENNVASNHINPPRYSEKSFILSQLELNTNTYSCNKGYTKSQLDKFLQRNEIKKQQVHQQVQEQKLQKEQKDMENVTFHPKINKKSEQLTQSTWEPIEERIERMQEKMIEKRKKQCEEEYTKFAYSPLINRKSSALASKVNRQPLNKSYNNLNRSTSPITKSSNQMQDLSASRNLNSSRKFKESQFENSRPHSTLLRSKNASQVQLNQKKIQKNDSTANISSFKDKNISPFKNGQNQSQNILSSQNNQDTFGNKTEYINFNDIEKEDYLLNFTQQYMQNKDLSSHPKPSKQGSLLTSTHSKNSQQVESKQIEESLQSSQIMNQSQPLKQRSRSSIAINKVNEQQKNIISSNNKIAYSNQYHKAIPLNSDSKFLLNLLATKKQQAYK